ncbi:MAG: orotidine-5'-phosphate decarboxylase [Betaproteobacteria bacterium]
MNDAKIIVALDFAEAESALALAHRLSPQLCRLKIGKELFTAAGPALVDSLTALGFAIFLDLKFHDIPNTVAQACKAAARMGVWMMNIHASGGRSMMRSARQALGDAPDRPLLIAVTVLTSLTEGELAETGVVTSVQEQVSRLTKLTADSGLDGVVCSALEAKRLRQERGEGFMLVTPGIRPSNEAGDDQKRIATPKQAMLDGASYLVVGRPITRAADPLLALQAIQTEIDDLT